MRYSALEVAKYIITKCSEAGKPVSNLKLQKMLYFLWIEFYRKTRRKLFYNDICAWQLGPVVPDVYYEYCPYAGIPIRGKYEVDISRDDRKIMDEFIWKYIDIPAFRLVNKTHIPGGAWSTVYCGGIGNRKVIPFELIIDKEV